MPTSEALSLHSVIRQQVIIYDMTLTNSKFQKITFVFFLEAYVQLETSYGILK